MKKKIMVEGMSCGHCVKHVKEALLEVEGVKTVDVSLEENTAIIDTSTEVADSRIKYAIEDAGYEVKSIEEI